MAQLQVEIEQTGRPLEQIEARQGRQSVAPAVRSGLTYEKNTAPEGR
jgi:hypothetical protein